MAEFRIVFLRDSVLEASEVTEAEDLLEAVQKASSERPELTAEIWSCGRKVAVIRPFGYNQQTAASNRAPLPRAVERT